MATTKQLMANDPIPVGVISGRAYGVLARKRVTLGILFALTEEEFLQIHGINETALKEVKSYFRKLEGEVNFFTSKWPRKTRLKKVFGEAAKAPVGLLEVLNVVDSIQRSGLQKFGITIYDDFGRVTYTQLKNREYGGKPLFTSQQLNALVKELKATDITLKAG